MGRGGGKPSSSTTNVMRGKDNLVYLPVPATRAASENIDPLLEIEAARAQYEAANDQRLQEIKTNALADFGAGIDPRQEALFSSSPEEMYQANTIIINNDAFHSLLSSRDGIAQWNDAVLRTRCLTKGARFEIGDPNPDAQMRVMENRDLSKMRCRPMVFRNIYFKNCRFGKFFPPTRSVGCVFDGCEMPSWAMKLGRHSGITFRPKSEPRFRHRGRSGERNDNFDPRALNIPPGMNFDYVPNAAPLH